MKVSIEIEFEEETKLVEFDYSYEWRNDGIGSYEFWGQVGYDHGVNYVYVYDMEWNKELYTEEENKEIEKQYDDIVDKIEEIETNK